MKRPSPAAGSFCFVCLAVGGVHGAEMGFVPVNASGDHTIMGNEIVLEGGGQTVFLELRMSDWSPTEVRAYEAALDSSGLSSGFSGVLTPTLIACIADADCLAAFGGFCTLTDEPCFQTSDCEFPQFGEVCDGPFPACAFPPKPDPPEFCAPAFVHEFRSDYVFRNVDSFEPIVDLGTEDFRWASLTSGGSVPDPGFSLYGGALVLNVPVGAVGTFVIELLPAPASVLIDPDGFPIEPLNLTAAQITVKCQTNGDCDDGNACTNDTCNTRDGTCVNVPNFDEETFCCDPADGTLTPISDDNECTEDICNSEDGTVSHPPLPEGTTCGDPTDTECDNPDTCDGAGACRPNFESSGASCGNPVDTECDNPDTCDGSGECQPNFEPLGVFCGDPSDTDCTDADTCDGAGTCQPNHAADGTECSTGFFCIVGETCMDGECVGGDDRDCSDGLVCTTDECNEQENRCDNDLLPGHCLIDGVCRDDGEFNPDNECEECNPAEDSFVWSFRPDGSLCTDDGNECTFDFCESGVCIHPTVEAGTPCGDPADTECDNPDTCDGDGVCGPNFEPADTPCGDSSDTDCTDPDACDGTGTCQPNHAPDGASCSTGFFCIVAEICADGQCLGGEERDCSDGLDCTTDECNEDQDQCDNDLLPDHCLIDGVCRDAGEFNPENDCEECNPAGEPFAWSFRSDGSACTDDGNECTFDFCEIGVCIHPPVDAGTSCGDATDTECDNPDTCDGQGVCLTNFEPADTPCGDSSETQCTDPDSCDGSGTCQPNHAPDGEPCDDEDAGTDNDVCVDGVCAGTPIQQAPVVKAFGPRRISVRPTPPGAPVSVALLLTSPDWPCLELYLNPDGSFTTTPVFQLIDDWGTVFVDGVEIAPDSRYDVVSESETLLSEVGSAQTSPWGDVVGTFDGMQWTPPDGQVVLQDILATIDRFLGKPTAPPVQQVDVWPCNPDGLMVIQDIVAVVDAFLGKPYPCPLPCP